MMVSDRNMSANASNAPIGQQQQQQSSQQQQQLLGAPRSPHKLLSHKKGISAAVRLVSSSLHSPTQDPKRINGNGNSNANTNTNIRKTLMTLHRKTSTSSPNVYSQLDQSQSQRMTMVADHDGNKPDEKTTTTIGEMNPVLPPAPTPPQPQSNKGAATRRFFQNAMATLGRSPNPQQQNRKRILPTRPISLQRQQQHQQPQPLQNEQSTSDLGFGSNGALLSTGSSTTMFAEDSMEFLCHQPTTYTQLVFHPTTGHVVATDGPVSELTATPPGNTSRQTVRADKHNINSSTFPTPSVSSPSEVHTIATYDDDSRALAVRPPPPPPPLPMDDYDDDDHDNDHDNIDDGDAHTTVSSSSFIPNMIDVSTKSAASHTTTITDCDYNNPQSNSNNEKTTTTMQPPNRGGHANSKASQSGSPRTMMEQQQQQQPSSSNHHHHHPVKVQNGNNNTSCNTTAITAASVTPASQPSKTVTQAAMENHEGSKNRSVLEQFIETSLIDPAFDVDGATGNIDNITTATESTRKERVIASYHEQIRNEYIAPPSLPVRVPSPDDVPKGKLRKFNFQKNNNNNNNNNNRTNDIVLKRFELTKNVHTSTKSLMANRSPSIDEEKEFMPVPLLEVGEAAAAATTASSTAAPTTTTMKLIHGSAMLDQPPQPAFRRKSKSVRNLTEWDEVAILEASDASMDDSWKIAVKEVLDKKKITSATPAAASVSPTTAATTQEQQQQQYSLDPSGHPAKNQPSVHISDQIKTSSAHMQQRRDDAPSPQKVRLRNMMASSEHGTATSPVTVGSLGASSKSRPSLRSGNGDRQRSSRSVASEKKDHATSSRRGRPKGSSKKKQRSRSVPSERPADEAHPSLDSRPQERRIQYRRVRKDSASNTTRQQQQHQQKRLERPSSSRMLTKNSTRMGDPPGQQLGRRSQSLRNFDLSKSSHHGKKNKSNDDDYEIALVGGEDEIDTTMRRPKSTTSLGKHKKSKSLTSPSATASTAGSTGSSDTSSTHRGESSSPIRGGSVSRQSPRPRSRRHVSRHKKPRARSSDNVKKSSAASSDRMSSSSHRPQHSESRTPSKSSRRKIGSRDVLLEGRKSPSIHGSDELPALVDIDSPDGFMVANRSSSRRSLMVSEMTDGKSVGDVSAKSRGTSRSAGGTSSKRRHQSSRHRSKFLVRSESVPGAPLSEMIARAADAPGILTSSSFDGEDMSSGAVGTTTNANDNDKSGGTSRRQRSRSSSAPRTASKERDFALRRMKSRGGGAAIISSSHSSSIFKAGETVTASPSSISRRMQRERSKRSIMSDLVDEAEHDEGAAATSRSRSRSSRRKGGKTPTTSQQQASDFPSMEKGKPTSYYKPKVDSTGTKRKDHDRRRKRSSSRHRGRTTRAGGSGGGSGGGRRGKSPVADIAKVISKAIERSCSPAKFRAME
eukprot:CAMPEP_0119551898 /NCGR_PEP_ID=MMETSP1352-20130426/5025_1 /TAXON_ID=265584 /ORGANISM="Stauroneis constricta, Strain CCMP1120" /LENGTH=1415 /DNA_ID=CAMNT_0007598023 /DNA_START=9 /DNA_END=4256 /DNA_ORIENTATION=+